MQQVLLDFTALQSATMMRVRSSNIPPSFTARVKRFANLA
jgi:hypothetical protein